MAPPPSGALNQDRFYAASIAQDEAFDAGQYSFFGDLDGGGGGDLGGLEGALEDGLEAPPEEEGLLDEGDELLEEDAPMALEPDLPGEDEDLSLAGIFRTGLGLGDTGAGDYSLFGGTSSSHVVQPPIGFGARPAAAVGRLAAPDLLDDDERELEALISDTFSAAMRQQDEEVATPRGMATATQSAQVLASLGRTPGPGGSSSAAGVGRSPLLDGQGGGAFSYGYSPLQGLPGMPAPGSEPRQQQGQQSGNALTALFSKAQQQPPTATRGPITAEELEAQMLGQAAARQQQQQQQQLQQQQHMHGPPFHPMHQQHMHMGPPPGMPMMQPGAPMMGPPGHPQHGMIVPGAHHMLPGGLMHPGAHMPYGPSGPYGPPLMMHRGPPPGPAPMMFPGGMPPGPHGQPLQPHYPGGPGRGFPPGPPGAQGGLVPVHPHALAAGGVVSVPPPPRPGPGQTGAVGPGGPGGAPRSSPYLTAVRPQAPPRQAHPSDFGFQGRGPRDNGGSGAPSSKAGSLMPSDDLEYVMRSMLAAVAGGAPYKEDFYFQAFVNKHLGGRNRTSFAPDELRDPGAELARLDPSARVRFVDVQGLGKIVLSNIRTPKVLMDLTSAAANAPSAAAAAAHDAGEGDAGAGKQQGPSKPLESEPLLAARMLVEDCISLLMDIEDCDRMISAHTPQQQGGQGQGGLMHGQPPLDVAALCQRRAVLLSAVTASLCLPTRAAPEGDAGVGDGVLLRLAMLPKGRTLLARVLLAWAATPTDPTPAGEEGSAASSSVAAAAAAAAEAGAGVERLLWALLRNAWALFSASGGVKAGDAAAERALSEATSKLAVAMRAATAKLKEPLQVAHAVQAFTCGCTAYVAAQTSPSSGPMDTTILPLALTKVVPGMFATSVTAASYKEASAAHNQASLPTGVPAATGAAAGTGSEGGAAAADALSAQQHAEWLGEALAALCNRAEQLGLRDAAGDAAGSGDGAEGPNALWRTGFASLYSLVSAHLEALQAIHGMASSSQNAQALALVRALTCRPLVQAMMLHAVPEQRTWLRDSMLRFLA